MPSLAIRIVDNHIKQYHFLQRRAKYRFFLKRKIMLLWIMINKKLHRATPMVPITDNGWRNQVPSERHRAVIAVVAMGLLYMLSFGEAALLISGSVIAIPLVFTFFHRLRASSLINAYVISAGIHAIANTIVVLFRGFLGGD